MGDPVEDQVDFDSARADTWLDDDDPGPDEYEVAELVWIPERAEWAWVTPA